MAIKKLDTSAEILLDGAQGYCDSMEVLSERPNKASVDAIGLLASHSLELALKSFLLMRGWNEEQLKKVGHDLEKAWIKAAECGLSINKTAPFWVRVLSLGHGYPYIYRYPQEGTAIAIPSLDELASNLKDLIQLIRGSSEEEQANA